MMIPSNLSGACFSGARSSSYDPNAFLTDKDKNLIEQLGWSSDLETAENNTPGAKALATRIAEDRQGGVLTGEVNSAYLVNLRRHETASPSGTLPVNLLYRAQNFLNPANDLPRGEFYTDEGLKAYSGNDMLTDSDKALIEKLGGSSDLVTAEKAPGLMQLVADIALARSTGELSGDVGHQFLSSVVQENQYLQQSGNILSVPFDILQKALDAVDSQSTPDPSQPKLDATA